MARLQYRQLDKQTRIGRSGARYLINDGRDTQEGQTHETLEYFERNKGHLLPTWLQEKLKKFEGKGLDYWALAAKFKDGFARRETAKKVRAAKTKEEKMAILEEFHKEAEKCRKQTALNLECMKPIRIIRQETKQRIPPSKRTYRVIGD